MMQNSRGGIAHDLSMHYAGASNGHLYLITARLLFHFWPPRAPCFARAYFVRQ